MCGNCRTGSGFAVSALPARCLGHVWPPWLPHGGKCDNFGKPKPPLEEPNGRPSVSNSAVEQMLAELSASLASGFRSDVTGSMSLNRDKSLQQCNTVALRVSDIVPRMIRTYMAVLELSCGEWVGLEDGSRVENTYFMQARFQPLYFAQNRIRHTYVPHAKQCFCCILATHETEVPATLSRS